MADGLSDRMREIRFHAGDDYDDGLEDFDQFDDGFALSDDGLVGSLSLNIARMDSSEVLYKHKRIPKMIGPYIMGDKLGEGSYSKVKEAIDCRTLERRAVKIMKNKKLRKISGGQANVKKEIELLKKLRHKHVIKMADLIFNHTKEKIYLVMEYCVGNLQEMLERAPGNKFPIWQAHSYFCQMMEGLNYLHGRNVVHRDIKPGNLLISASNLLKISDFGVADLLDKYSESDKCTSSSGSPAFQPPEIANGAESFSGFKVDVWAAGVTLWNFTTGTYPFEGEHIYTLYHNIGLGQYILPKTIAPSLRKLLLRMLDIDAASRASVHEVLAHPWVLADYPEDEEAISASADEDHHAHETSVVEYLKEMFPGDLVKDRQLWQENDDHGDLYSPLPGGRRGSFSTFFSNLF